MEPNSEVIAGPVKVSETGEIARVASVSEDRARVEVWDSGKRCWRASRSDEADAADVMAGKPLSAKERAGLSDRLCEE